MGFVIQDDALAPRKELILVYDGPNPVSIYPQVDPMMRTIFEAKGTHMFEPVFKWDASGDPRSFYIKVQVKKGIDRFTKFEVNVLLWGTQPADKTKTGNVKIIISGFVNTDFPASKLFEKYLYTPFFYLYNIGYYNKIRRQYVQWVRDGIYKLESQIRQKFNMPQSENQFRLTEEAQ